MENRKAFDLKNTMVLYNFSIVGLSSYMIYEVGYVIMMTTPVDTMT